MTNSDGDELLSERSKKLIREEAFKLVELRNKLEEALKIAKTLHREPTASEIKEELGRRIDEINRTFARRTYFQALRDMPWSERLVDRLRMDRFLFVASLASFAAALVTLVQVIDHWDALVALFEHIRQILIPSAHAASNDVMGVNVKQAISLLSLLVISIGFFAALAIIGFSNKPDSRKFAADMIKTILGVYAGMLTRFLD